MILPRQTRMDEAVAMAGAAGPDVRATARRWCGVVRTLVDLFVYGQGRDHTTIFGVTMQSAYWRVEEMV